jgi:hypothetical protein
VREGFKRKNEKYQLFWPQRSEFVRMAAKFGATIVPVASVGAEDCVNILMDTEDIKGHALLGGWRGVWGFGKGEGGRCRVMRGWGHLYRHVSVGYTDRVCSTNSM